MGPLDELHLLVELPLFTFRRRTGKSMPVAIGSCWRGSHFRDITAGSPKGGRPQESCMTAARDIEQRLLVSDRIGIDTQPPRRARVGLAVVAFFAISAWAAAVCHQEPRRDASAHAGTQRSRLPE